MSRRQVYRVEVSFTKVSRPMAHLRYQQYFLLAMRAAGAELCIRPWRASVGHRLLDSHWRGAYRLNPDRPTASHRRGDEYVRYVVTSPAGERTKIVFDPADGRSLRHAEALDWCDVYYKTNYWQTLDYPAPVRPLTNPNPLLNFEALQRLRQLRRHRKSNGVLFWSKIWEFGEGGSYTEAQRRNVVEHQIRVFETLAKLGKHANLIALVPEGMRSVDGEAVRKRLRSAGISVRSSWGTIDTRTLWEALASASVVALRPGNHLSVSWRMSDLLAMGSCIVSERAPFARWHVPLRAGRQYLDGGCGLAGDFSLPCESHYARLTERIGGLLENSHEQARLREAAANYFDAHCSPEALGNYLLDHSHAWSLVDYGRTARQLSAL